MAKQIIHTDGAPQAIGTYSQAVKVNGTVYLSGQIGLDPSTMQMVEGIEQQVHRVFKNLAAVAAAAATRLCAGGRCAIAHAPVMDAAKHVTLPAIVLRTCVPRRSFTARPTTPANPSPTETAHIAAMAA